MLYKHSAPYNTGYLRVDHGHTLYYEQFGRPDGKPVVVLHGGPGTGMSTGSTTFFDPEIFRVVLFDQRGAGRSTPAADTEHNTPQELVSDVETLRKFLEVEKWQIVYGGSWGSTLALLYTQTHPDMVVSLIILGVWTLRKWEINFLFDAAGKLFPEAYGEFLSLLPEGKRTDPVPAYYNLLRSNDSEIRHAAAKAWSKWDYCTIESLNESDRDYTCLEDDVWCLQRALIVAHYFVNNGFLEEGEILKQENVDKIRHIPGSIVQGRYDIVCPPQTAWDLHKAWPEAALYMIPMAGHMATHPGMSAKLVEICDKYGQLEKA